MQVDYYLGLTAMRASQLSLQLVLGIAAHAAALSVHSSIGSSMVLQRDREVTLWGAGHSTSAPVTVTVGNSTQFSNTSTGAVWSVRIGPFAAGSHGVISVSQLGTSIELTDVLFGDVFLCSGEMPDRFSFDLLTIQVRATWSSHLDKASETMTPSNKLQTQSTARFACSRPHLLQHQRHLTPQSRWP